MVGHLLAGELISSLLISSLSNTEGCPCFRRQSMAAPTDAHGSIYQSLILSLFISLSLSLSLSLLQHTAVALNFAAQYLSKANKYCFH